MQITQPFNDFRIAVIQKTAFGTVQRGDCRHVVVVQFETENVEILGNALLCTDLGMQTTSR